MKVIALVEHLALNIWVHIEQSPHLTILLRDELLVQRRNLYEEIFIWQVEVRSEELDGVSVTVEFDRERLGFVLPRETVEVQE